MPRPPDLDYAPYTFPSKLLEYLATGKLVVSTRLPGIPEEYWEVLVACDPTPASVAAAIHAAARSDSPQEHARRLAFVARRRAPEQGRRLVDFLKELRPPREKVSAMRGAAVIEGGRSGGASGPALEGCPDPHTSCPSRCSAWPRCAASGGSSRTAPCLG